MADTAKTPTLAEMAKRLDALEEKIKKLIEAVDAAASRGPLPAPSSAPSAGGSAGSDAPITTLDISDALSGILDDFNAKANTGRSSVGYMMSGVEIDLKTVVTKEEGSLILRSAAGKDVVPETVSTLKMSARAVPRRAEAAKKI